MTRAKYAMSALWEGQGRPPARPMPREGVAARMRVNGRRGFRGGGIAGCAVLVIVGGVWWREQDAGRILRKVGAEARWNVTGAP